MKNIRKTKVRTARNKAKKQLLKKTIKEFKLAPNKETALSLLPKVQSIIDKAAKWGIIHKNKAARLKAKLAQSLIGTK
ncbi:MAG: 30S ribosomal protein S20 [candidate division WOR-3 bacterium]